MLIKMPKKDDRLYLAPLGETYEDLLSIDAFLRVTPSPNKEKLPQCLSQAKETLHRRRGKVSST
jgi:hypothetical protein